MAHKLFSTEKKLTSPHTFLLEQVVVFPKYHAWLYFDTGHWQLWDIYNQELIHQGSDDIEADNTLKFQYFDEQSVAFYSKTKKKIEVFNVFEKNKDLRVSKSYDHCILPTAQALPESDQNDEEKKENLQCFTEIVTLTESKMIVVMEPKPQNQTFNDHIITAFNSEKQVNQLNHNSQNKQLFILPFNKKDTIVLYSQCFMNQPIEFFLWNCDTTQFKKYMFKEKMECVLIDARPWKANQMAFFVNPNNTAKPKMLLFDVSKDTVIAPLDLTENEAMLSEVHVVNGDQDVVLFESFQEEVKISLFNPLLKKITSHQAVTNDPHTAVSQDKKFIVEVEDSYDGQDGHGREMVMNAKISLISELKYYILFMLDEKKYTSKFGQGIIQEIVEILTKKKE